MPNLPNHILKDLCARFILNVPKPECDDIVRLFFQMELAHWFYLDFVRDDDEECCYVGMKDFAFQIFRCCDKFAIYLEDFDRYYEEWKVYKSAVPTYGAILLDPTLQYCLLLQGYNVKASWSFAKGKVNEDERPEECAIREVYEETGFDIKKLIDPSNFLEHSMNEQTCRLYVVRDVPMDTKFKPLTRNEVKRYSWFEVENLPTHKLDPTSKLKLNIPSNNFFMVMPFVRELKQRISEMKGRDMKMEEKENGERKFDKQPEQRKQQKQHKRQQKHQQQQQKQQQQKQQQQQQQQLNLYQHANEPMNFGNQPLLPGTSRQLEQSVRNKPLLQTPSQYLHFPPHQTPFMQQYQPQQQQTPLLTPFMQQYQPTYQPTYQPQYQSQQQQLLQQWQVNQQQQRRPHHHQEYFDSFLQNSEKIGGTESPTTSTPQSSRHRHPHKKIDTVGSHSSEHSSDEQTMATRRTERFGYPASRSEFGEEEPSPPHGASDQHSQRIIGGNVTDNKRTAASKHKTPLLQLPSQQGVQMKSSSAGKITSNPTTATSARSLTNSTHSPSKNPSSTLITTSKTDYKTSIITTATTTAAATTTTAAAATTTTTATITAATTTATTAATYTWTTPETVTIATKSNEAFLAYNFMSPAWSNFKLDVEQLLNAMCS
ncbi:hypothetical protein HELRODRAFT_105717 [Helobdella robusta]|uniref:mRNA-decapping enzyme 2 n=1 Tax=Helobdella robusta TaxID=6412 RepID=T1EDX2_HELRO|nr:hypothetical protein HELRODRAFT_105717 [Helobdella robusta]ESO13096.1 hypothetical protein HELRODRAFT_105717 [Helobdella robusta]